MTSFTVDLQQALTRNETYKALLEGIRTALVLQKTAFQQHILSYVKEREKPVAAKAAAGAEFRK